MKISDIIIDYYYKNKRDLVWRGIKNPYFIWVSEIMLQQTRVNQVKYFFNRFISCFPDVQSLAEADENEVLKLWQGLGYYSRARNIHLSAKFIVNELKGSFPCKYEDLLKLKGVGEYTAAAIASIAFNEQIAVVDGNVYRVLSRLFDEHSSIDTAKGKKRFKELAAYMIKEQVPGDFNQAMIEFGATVCTPAKPNCIQCPVSTQCLALSKGTVLQLPSKKKALKVKNRYLHYLIIIDDNNTFLQKRKNNDIWKGLYEFPLIETKNKKTLDAGKFLLSCDFFDYSEIDMSIVHISDEITHRLSHQALHVRFYVLKIDGYRNKKQLLKVSLSEMEKYAVPKVIENFLNTIFNVLSVPQRKD
jgi:A/G-specific adenine glycosylase